MTEHSNLIDGLWVGSDDMIANINPSDTSDIIGRFAAASERQVRDAIDASSNAFGNWSLSSPQLRSDILDKAGSEIAARKDELGELLAREEGKTRAQGIGEVNRTAQILKFFSGEALRMTGETVRSIRDGVSIDVTREPIGVVGVITPWNFPMSLPAWKIAAALAYGNTVVFKPAQLVPASAWALVDILHRAGVPKGVVSLVMGRGSVVGPVLAASQKIAGITFTGSTATGRGLASACIGRGAKIQLELGGKNPFIILDDADLDLAVEAVVDGAFFLTGQRCTASSRLIVTKSTHDAFVERLVAKTKNLIVDHALKPGTQIGPVVDKSQLGTDLYYIDLGKKEGATPILEGETVERATNGYFLTPTVFVDTTNDMRINREEIFGPIAGVIKVDDLEQAVSVANDTVFGLSAGIATTSLKSTAYFKQHIKAGMTMVNLATAGVDYHVPFGGIKESGYGPKEQGRAAIEFFTNLKTGYVRA